MPSECTMTNLPASLFLFLGLICGSTAVPTAQHSELLSFVVQATKLRIQRAPSGQWVDGGPCSRHDHNCMNTVALRYVNEIRAEKGLAPYDMGSTAQLENAMAHTSAMNKAGSLFHQNIHRVSLGCESLFSGENVSMNHLIYDSKYGSDPARLCVEQFRKSSQHYQNLVSSFHRQFVMGVVVASDNYIWCCQTFAVNTHFGSRRCETADWHLVRYP